MMKAQLQSPFLDADFSVGAVETSRQWRRLNLDSPYVHCEIVSAALFGGEKVAIGGDGRQPMANRPTLSLAEPILTEMYDYDNESLAELESGIEEEVPMAERALPTMKFEFQTSNMIWRNDGTAASLLERKYGPDDFLVNVVTKKVRLESETDGVLEFETEWFRKWPKLKAAIEKAVEMTNDMNAAGAAKFEASRKSFPFDFSHLRNGSAKEKAQGFWDPRLGKENDKQKILSATELLEVELVDSTWNAGIQSSEGFFLEQYESYLEDHEWPHFIDGTIKGVKTILDATVTAGMASSELARLRNFLLIIVNYIMRGQGGQVSKDSGAFKDVKGMPAKQAFTLMSRTNFASMYKLLLGSDAQAAFKKIVEKDRILDAQGLNRKSPFFIAGYGSLKVGFHAGPTVHAWLTGIYNGNDLLTPKSGNGMSAAMGKYPVTTEPGDKDRWLVKFETRNSVKGAFAESKDWVSHVSTVYALASARRKRPVAWLLLPLGNKADQFLDLVAVDVRDAISLAHKQGVTDEDALTNLVFNSLHLERGGRPIRRAETDLAKEWLLIRKDSVRPFLELKGSKEASSLLDEGFVELELAPEREDSRAGWVADGIESREIDEDEGEQADLLVDEADRYDKAPADASQ